VGKPRYSLFLNQDVKNSAYFTKHSSWNYEIERRLVVKDSDIVNVSNNMILYIPIDCVTAIIAGPRTTPNDKDKSVMHCEKLAILYLDTKLGKSRSTPYFVGNLGKNKCSWCSITEADMENAAMKNPLRMLDNMDLLEGYLASFGPAGK